MTGSIKHKIAKGAFWSFIERSSTLFSQVICNLVIARFLAPSNYGMIGMLSIFISFAMVITDSGFSQALIRKQNVSNEDFCSVFFINLSIGLILYILLYAFAPIIAEFYNEPALVKVARISFLVVPISVTGLIQNTILIKNTQFENITKVTLVSTIISGTIGIVYAIIYKNIWALVLQNLSFYISKTTMFWMISKWRPIFTFSYRRIKDMTSFSINLLCTGSIASIFDNMYSLAIGKYYNSSELGFYYLPNKLQMSVSGTLSFSIHRVTYPILSTFQDNNIKLKRSIRKIIGIAFYIILPIMMLLLVIAGDLFDILLSPKWNTGAIYFRYLCIVGALFPLADINLDLLLIKNKTRLGLKLEIIRKIIMCVILFSCIQISMKAVIIGLVVYTIFNTIFTCYFTGKQIDLSIITQVTDLLPIIIVVALTMSIVYGAGQLMSNMFIKVITQVFISVPLYFFMSYIFKVSFQKDLFAIVMPYLKGNIFLLKKKFSTDFK